MAKIGDTVRFLNTVGGGRIVRIEGQLAYVEDSDGFEVPALLKECVVVMKAEEAPRPAAPKVEFGKAPATTSSLPSKEIVAPEPDPLPPPRLTPEGEKLNIVLGILADNLKALSGSSYTAELVNDSNYYIAFSLASRSEDSEQWTLIKAATIEPDTVLTLCSLDGSDIQKADRLCLQYTAFKTDDSYDLKPAESVELKVDTTKFFKFHCFKENEYFDEPVIAFDFVRDDRPNRPLKVDPAKVREAMAEKRRSDAPKSRPLKKKAVHRSNIIEVDLHIGELTDTTRGLSNADMLNLQIDTFRRVMDENLDNPGQKIVFIHGKGEGVLRNALLKELTHRYKGHDVQDASFREYGFGATQVTIRAVPKGNVK